MKYFVLLSVLILNYCIDDIYAHRSRDYCSPSLCSSGEHIACANNTYMSSSCSDDRMIDMEPYKTLILDRHNEIRDRIASGHTPRFDPALRMPTMAWNSELEYLASLNVKRCKSEHDSCRNTDRFRNSGQNLASEWAMPGSKPRDTINWALDLWINEQHLADMGDIESYSDKSNEVSRFTLMVSERNTRVGCAMLWQSGADVRGPDFFFTCNYATGNILNHPVYRSGRRASECTRGTNKMYPALCNIREPIDPNKI